MATQMVRQTTFTAGEIDEVNWKRTELDAYLTAAQSLLNAEVGTTGLARKRKGTKLDIDLTDYAISHSHGYEFVDKNGNYYAVIAANEEFHIFSMADNSFVQTVSTPYVAADLDELDFSLGDSVLVLTHANYPTARLYVESYGPVVFAYQALVIYPQPAFDFNNIDYNNFTVSLSSSGNVLTFRFTGLMSDPGFDNAWIGGQIIGGGASDIDPIGYAIITAVSYSMGTTTFTATIQVPFNTSTPATTGNQFSVKQPAFTAALGYPARCLFYQNRLWLANTKSLTTTIFGSKLNAPLNYDVGIGKDTDAIIYTIGQSGSGGIVALNGGKQLEIFTTLFEFVCPQEQGIALTPSSFSIRTQSSYGSSRSCMPISYINDTYYIALTGKAIINYHFDGVGLAYDSKNISVGSQHLVKNPVNRALVRGSDVSQDNFLYFLNPDDTLTTFQFANEYKLAALTPVEFQEDVEVIDIFTINNKLYLLKYYVLTEVFTLEHFYQDQFFLDGYVELTMNTAGLVTGLDNYVGYTVQVVFENQDYGQYEVDEDGEIIVFNPNEDSGTVQVGFLYDVEIRPMYLFAGANEADFFKNISRIYVDYYQSLNFYINGKLVNFQNFADIQNEVPLGPQSGTWIVDPVLGWNRFSTFSITQSSPFDLQIISISYQIDAAIV